MDLVSKRYDALKALERHDNFYDYEKEFEQIWLDTGKEVLERNLGETPQERRKKKHRNQIRPHSPFTPTCVLQEGQRG